MLNVNPVVNLMFAVSQEDIPVTHVYEDGKSKPLVFRKDEMKVYDNKLYAYHFTTDGNKDGTEDITKAKMMNVRQMANDINEALGNIGTICFGTRTNTQNDACVIVGPFEIVCHVSRVEEHVWFTLVFNSGLKVTYLYEEKDLLIKDLERFLK